MLYPVELRAQQDECIAAAHPSRPEAGRGRGIRTLDIQLPKLALYQAELYPADNQHSALHCKQKARDNPTKPQPATADYPLVRPEPHRPATIKRVPKHPSQSGAPGEIRTPDHQVRSLVLYPAELRARRSGIIPSQRTYVNPESELISFPFADGDCGNLQR